jgi:hypothetical protein
MMAVAGLAFGQGRVGPVGQGFGSVVFPGTGVPGHASSLGSSIRGVYPGGGGGHGRPQNPRPPAVVVPVPVYVGGYGYGYGYNGYAPQEQQPVTIVNQAPAVPSVIINQGYTPDRAQPAMYEYNPQSTELNSYQAPVPSHPEPVKPASFSAVSNDDTPTVYLIALKDGTVYSAYAYWLEADTLHYITTKHSHNKATLALVDESLSLQLNRERHVEFKLRAAR